MHFHPLYRPHFRIVCWATWWTQVAWLCRCFWEQGHLSEKETLVFLLLSFSVNQSSRSGWQFTRKGEVARKSKSPSFLFLKMYFNNVTEGFKDNNGCFQSQTSSKCLCGLFIVWCWGVRAPSPLCSPLCFLPLLFFVMLLRFPLNIKLNFPDSFLLIQATNYREMRNDLQHLGIFWGRS